MFKLYGSLDNLTPKELNKIATGRIYIVIEAIMFFLLSVVGYIMLNQNVLMLLVCIGLLINAAFILYKSKIALIYVKKQNPRYKAQEALGVFFIYWKQFKEAQTEKGTATDKDIEYWQKYFFNILKKKNSTTNICMASDEIKRVYSKNFGCEIKEPSEQQLDKYMVREYTADIKKYYPDFPQILASNKFSLLSEDASKRVQGQLADSSRTAKSENPISEQLRILNLSANTTDMKIIKQRYFELARIYHPDKTDEDTSEQLREINQAYSDIRQYFQNRGNK